MGEGCLRMEANNVQSYYVKLSMRIQGTNICSEAQKVDLKDPEYRFYTSPNAYCPPGTANAWGRQAEATNYNGAATTQHSYQQAQCMQPIPMQQHGIVTQQGYGAQQGVQYQDPSQAASQVTTSVSSTQVGAQTHG